MRSSNSEWSITLTCARAWYFTPIDVGQSKSSVVVGKLSLRNAHIKEQHTLLKRLEIYSAAIITSLSGDQEWRLSDTWTNSHHPKLSSSPSSWKKSPIYFYFCWSSLTGGVSPRQLNSTMCVRWICRATGYERQSHYLKWQRNGCDSI